MRWPHFYYYTYTYTVKSFENFATLPANQSQVNVNSLALSHNPIQTPTDRLTHTTPNKQTSKVNSQLSITITFPDFDSFTFLLLLRAVRLQATKPSVFRSLKLRLKLTRRANGALSKNLVVFSCLLYILYYIKYKYNMPYGRI